MDHSETPKPIPSIDGNFISNIEVAADHCGRGDAEIIVFIMIISNAYLVQTKL